MEDSELERMTRSEMEIFSHSNNEGEDEGEDEAEESIFNLSPETLKLIKVILYSSVYALAASRLGPKLGSWILSKVGYSFNAKLI